MENKLNIAELLKDCPPGMELDCTMYENCTFEGIYDIGYTEILVKTPSGQIRLTKEGCFTHNDKYAKCVIFPKGKTTWEGFQVSFKDGDIVATTNGIWIGITTGGEIGKFMPTYCVIQCDGRFEAYLDTKETWQFYRLATEEEKQKLFDAIRENGYKWNNETKTLEKIVEPKFKVGDIIQDKYGYRVRIEITEVNIAEEYYGYTSKISRETEGILLFKHQDAWEELQDDWKLVPEKFDINTLVPFETKVLVRDSESQKWRPAIWGYYAENCSNYLHAVVGGSCWKYCIPYEGNEHLLGKKDDCEEFYKTWKD